MSVNGELVRVLGSLDARLAQLIPLPPADAAEWRREESVFLQVPVCGLCSGWLFRTATSRVIREAAWPRYGPPVGEVFTLRPIWLGFKHLI